MNQRTNSGHGQRSNNDMHSVYSLNPDTKDANIVDVIVMIMDDDGPKPMRNLRPAQKQRNGAERFDMEHQEEYEARGRQADKVTRVSHHNNACPKMYDELNKRKSMTKIKAIDSKPRPQKQPYKHKGQSGNKSKRLKVVEKSKLRLRKRRSANRPKRKDVSSRVTKCKSRRCRHCVNKYKMYQLSSKSCQITPYSKNIATSDVSFNVCSRISKSPNKNMDSAKMERSLTILYDNDHYDERNSTYPAEKRRESSKELNRENSQSNHTLESRNPDSNPPSVSSYNSYLSMDHEPMVAP